MAKRKQPKPKHLAKKLRQIRLSFGLSQSEMLRRLGMEEIISYTKISHYELGIREPSLFILLQYARVANVYVDVLVDDELDLPSKLPSSGKHEGIRWKFATTRRQK
jgi:transcriptional regulator with XRE-family HTH domain